MCDTSELLGAKLIPCIIESFLDYISSDSGLDVPSGNEIMEGIVGIGPPEKNGQVVFFQKPDGVIWESIYEATWVSGGGQEMLALGLAALLLGTMFSGLATIVSGEAKPFRTDMPGGRLTGFIAILFSYPIGVTLIGSTFFLAQAIAPTPENFVTVWEPVENFFNNPITGTIDNLTYATTFWAFITALKFLFVMGGLVLSILLYTLPVSFGIAYAGFPVLASYARSAIRSIVPLALLPIPISMTTRGITLFDKVIENSSSITKFWFETGDGEMTILLAWGVITVYLTWKMLAQGAPRLTNAIGGTAKVAVKGAISLAGAGVVAASGGSGFAIAHAYRGNYARSAIYTTNADFDYKPRDPDTKRRPDENQTRVTE